MAMIFRQLFSTKAYLDDVASIFNKKIRIANHTGSGAGPDLLDIDEVAADIIGVSSADLEKWIGDDSSLSNLTDPAVYVALKTILSRYSRSNWDYEDGTGFNYLAPINIVAQEVANNAGDLEHITAMIESSKANLTQKFNPYQILGYSPYSIYDSISKDIGKKFVLSKENSNFKDLLALALVTDYSLAYAGLDEDGAPLYDLALYPSSVNRLIDPVAMVDAVNYVYLDGFNHLSKFPGISVTFKEFEDIHPLMCAYASYCVRVKTAVIPNLPDPTLRVDWQVHRMKDFYSRYPSSIALLIQSVSYADMIAILSGRQLESTDEAGAISPYNSAYNVANIWGAYLNLCKSSDQSLWAKYDCGQADPYLYCPMIGKSDLSYGFVNATALPHLLPEISVSSFKSLRDNRINDKLLNLILSNLKIASSASSTGINVCDCDGEWWPSSSSYYDSVPSVVFLSKNATFSVDSSAITAKKTIKAHTTKLTIFDKRSYFTYSVSEMKVKVLRRVNASQKFMSVFLGLADDYQANRIATDSIIAKAVKANSQVSMFDSASKLWQKALIDANIELLTRQLIRSIDSATRVSIDPTRDFNQSTSYWYDKLIKYITDETGMDDCNWVNSSLGPSITGNHLISINKHAIATGCIGGGLYA